MFKRIASKATKGKGRSWKAHQSSSSNPETNKFRAKARLMRLHNLAVQAGNSTVAIDFKSMSLSDKSASSSSINKLTKVKLAPVPLTGQKRKRGASVMEDDGDGIRAKKVRKQPRSRPESEDEFSGGDSDDEKYTRQESKTVKTRGIYRDTSKSKKDEPGAQFRAKKAAGDMKKSGAPDPYAYLPLDRKNLKKRSGTKNQFKGMIGAAKRGALVGQKLRHQRNKKK